MPGTTSSPRRLLDHEVEELTHLLHRAYAEQAVRGFRFAATHQGPDDIRKRIQGRECWVIADGGIVATVTVTPPDGGRPLAEAGCVTYTRAGLARINLFAVDPDRRKRG